MAINSTLQRRMNALADLPLECDGMTRVISFALWEAGVRHAAKAGDLVVDGVLVVPIHFWIEIDGSLLVDYRARLWARGGDHVPHGVFHPGNFPRVEYSGAVVDVSIPRAVFDALTRDRRADVFGTPR